MKKKTMLSSVTLNCQLTMIVMNSGSELPDMSTIFHMLTRNAIVIIFVFVIVFYGPVTCKRYQVSRIGLLRCLLYVFVFFFFWSGYISSSV